MLISGTITNTIHQQMMNSKWQQKKNSGEILSKEERNERANWTQEEWLKNDIEEQAAQNRETSKKTDIDNKIMYGGTLTPEEEQYLEQNDPSALQKYKEIKAEKKAYEEKLNKCKTKDEVQRVKTETMAGYLASLKKEENDPYIPMSEKLAKAQEMLAKTRNVEKVEMKFMASARYDNLPTEAEEAEERSKEREAVQEQALEEVEQAVDDTKKEEEVTKAEDSAVLEEADEDSAVLEEADEDAGKKEPKADTKEADILKEIEDTCQRIQFSAQFDSRKEVESKNNSKDTVGQKINITV